MKELQTQRALQFLQSNKLLYVDMLECIRRNRAEIVYAQCDNFHENGVLLYDKPTGVYMLASLTKTGAGTALRCLKDKEVASKSGWIVTHGDAAKEGVYEYMNVVWETPTWQVVYLQNKMLTVENKLRFAFAERAQIEIIKANYEKESPENIERLAANKKIYCAFVDDDFVGFIGEHPEGSMGLLYIFPNHRRKGYAESLESFLVNEYLRQGRIPYGHVVVGNEASMGLQNKLGFVTADEKVYWLKEG